MPPKLKEVTIRVPYGFPDYLVPILADEVAGYLYPVEYPFMRQLGRLLIADWKRERKALEVMEARERPVRRLYQLLGRRGISPELRSAAARSMLRYRGALATNAKMKALGYPNLVKAPEALRRKAKG